MDLEQKKILFSGIQPSGAFTLGNYIGSLRNWKKLQDDYECIYCVVDLHAITVDQVPATLRKNTFDAVCMLLACGVDPSKSTLFLQSHVPAHAELAWVLNCFTQFGEAKRMTQFKDKSLKHPENVNVGLFSYPTLMAADILLYSTSLVPIGEDQKQHLELARNIANRFNNKYSPTFVVPEGYIPNKSEGGRIMSLADPTAKMSKSDPNPNGFILLQDSPDVIMSKFKKAVTDSENKVALDANRPGITNLITIMSVMTNQTPEQIVQEYESKGYAEFKKAVAESVIACLEPIQTEYKRLTQDKAYINQVITEGAQNANYRARKILSKVYKKVGFYL